MKKIFGIFICFLSIILMSHNAFAVELISDVVLVKGNHNMQIRADEWSIIDGFCNGLNTSYVNSISCNGTAALKDFSISIPSIQYYKGQWIVAEFYVNQNLNNVSNHFTFYGLQYSGSNPVDLAYQEVSELTANSSKITVYFRAWGNFFDSNLRLTGKNGASAFFFNAANGTNPELMLRAGLVNVFSEKNPSDYSGSINDVKNSVNSINETLKQQQEEDENAMNDAVNDANNSAESNKQNVQDATGDTQSSVQGIIDVVLNTGPSDCKINADLGQVDLGELNMCSAPASFLNIINTVAGIVGVIVTVNVGRKVIYDVQEIIMRVTNG